MKDMPVCSVELVPVLERSCGDILRVAPRMAVALSGGPDSMALCHALSMWARQNGDALEIHALHVNHGLRAKAGEEAAWVKENTKDAHVEILEWEGNKPNARIQEEARTARYELMASYCHDHGISHLFLAHHEDDQAETFLFRLAKGSGLDGLGGMRSRTPYDEKLEMVRPFLETPKTDLLRYCEENSLDFICDPSNQNSKFARVRLRQAREVLEEEGLSAKRLSVTAKRLMRARYALDIVADDAYKNILSEINTKRIVLKKRGWDDLPDELALRVLLKAMGNLSNQEGYGVRLERMEDLFEAMRKDNVFRRRTLGGVIFDRADKSGEIILEAEQ